MISIDKVKVLVKTLGGYDDSEIEQLEDIIEANVQSASELVLDENQHSSPKVELFAAAMANYQLSIINKGDGVTSFTAGDISINQSADGIKNAKLLLEEARAGVSQLIADTGFAFLGV